MNFISPALAQTSPVGLSSNAPTASDSLAVAAQQLANPYGLGALWAQGDWVAKLTLLLLVLMSVASWVVIVRKFLELRATQMHLGQAMQCFDNVSALALSLGALGPDNPLRYVNETGIDAVRQFSVLKPRVDYDTWIIRALETALAAVQTRMQSGLALLATIGSTAPFVGLFGTVWAIYSALVQIGVSGQASIDRVAGPVGEALIMTAIGLAVAVPAVFGYNWLVRKNKLALEGMRQFTSRLHVFLLATNKTEAP